MRGMPFNPVEGQGVSVSQIYSWKSSTNISNKRKKEGGGEGLIEPRSVLDNRRSPSPPTSTSTLSSSLGGGGGSSDSAGVAAVSDSNTTTTTTTTTTTKWPPSNPTEDGGGGGALKKEEWAAELPPIPMGLAGGGGINDWETMLSEPAASPSQEQTFLRWIMGDFADDPSKLHHHHHLLSQNLGDLDNSANVGFGLVDPGFGLDPIAGIGVSASTTSPLLQPQTLASAPVPAPPPLGNPIFMSPPMPPGMFFQETMEEKPQLYAPQNPAFYLPLPPFPTQQDAHHLLLPPNPKRHHSIPINPPPQVSAQAPQDLFLRRNQPPQSFPYQLQPRPMKPKSSSGDESALTHQQQQQQALVDQLLEVAELAEAGTTVSAREILARLNHQLPPSPLGKPFLRSAFYFKEALHLLLADTPQTRPPFSTPLVSPWDVVFKLSAYKAFSEVSPVLQFTNFTCTQALLEELGGADRIHIVDFDIGVGGQWSSFMQELAHRRSPAVPSLKVTAFVSPCSYHPLELHLTRENLSHFASDLNIPFEFSILSIDSFNPAELLAMPNGAEATAVNLPVGSSYNPSFPALLRLVKQLNPKIVVSVDQGCDRSDLPFSHHFLQAFQSCMVLLDSIDAAGTNADAVNKIERYLVQPRIENSVLGRHRAAEKMLPWRTLFASAGFMPVQFSNFTETQAECLLKRVQVRGFHVEKRQASLFLYWQRGELVSVSAWRC